MMIRISILSLFFIGKFQIMISVFILQKVYFCLNMNLQIFMIRIHDKFIPMKRDHFTKVFERDIKQYY
jgi:hypothetical protein